MPPIAKALTELIGNTPLLEPARYMQKEGCEAHLLLKLEGFNPLHSSKDLSLIHIWSPQAVPRG